LSFAISMDPMIIIRPMQDIVSFSLESHQWESIIWILPFINPRFVIERVYQVDL
jgi:hypothetical protein